MRMDRMTIQVPSSCAHLPSRTLFFFCAIAFKVLITLKPLIFFRVGMAWMTYSCHATFCGDFSAFFTFKFDDVALAYDLVLPV